MRLYIFPPSARVIALVALVNYLKIDCELQIIDLGRGDQLTSREENRTSRALRRC
jgi:glutathione S-transferase